QVGGGARGRVRDDLVMSGVALDHRADDHDRVNVLAAQQLLDRRTHVEHARHVDDVADLDAEERRMAARPLLHRGGYVKVELRHYHRDFHVALLSSRWMASRISTPPARR